MISPESTGHQGDDTGLNGPSTPVTDVPVAVPTESSSSPRFTASHQGTEQTRETNTPAQRRPETALRTHSRQARRRIGSVQLVQIADALSDRDRHILALLATHSYLSTKHIEALSFSDNSASTRERLSRRVMARLERVGLVQSIERRVGGIRAGSSATVWQLSAAGRRLVTSEHLAKKPHEPSPRLLAHSLAVADTRIAIESLRSTPQITTADVQVESLAWRSYLGIAGDRRLLQPDLAVTISGADAGGHFDDAWFIEVDCGTESIPTLMRKCQQYEDYRESGIEQEAHGIFPRVLWVMGGSRQDTRIESLRSRLTRGSYPDGLFTVCSTDEVAEQVGGAP